MAKKDVARPDPRILAIGLGQWQPNFLQHELDRRESGLIMSLSLTVIVGTDIKTARLTSSDSLMHTKNCSTKCTDVLISED